MKAKMVATVTLELTQEEAEWLKSLMIKTFSVNPFFKEESEKDSEMRDRFWKALQNEGVRTI